MSARIKFNLCGSHLQWYVMRNFMTGPFEYGIQQLSLAHQNPEEAIVKRVGASKDIC